jgi:hypothetical protein
MARKGRYEEEVLQKVVRGRTAPVCSVELPGLRAIMAAVKFSPAVASRRAKYDGDFRVPTLLGAHPLDHTANAPPTPHAQYRHGIRT